VRRVAESFVGVMRYSDSVRVAIVAIVLLRASSVRSVNALIEINVQRAA